MKSTFKSDLKEEPISWGKVQLVRYKSNNGGIVIVLTTGDVGESTFSGTVINSTGIHRVGEVKSTWNKSLFEKLPEGESVTLEN